MRSISGLGNYAGYSLSSGISLAQVNGEGWYIDLVCDRFLIQDLLILMAKSTNSQAKIGTGRVLSSNNNAINTGTMNENGLFWGSNNQTSGVKAFGMENLWGNLLRRAAGLICDRGFSKS